MSKTRIQVICEDAEKRIIEELENHWNVQLDRFGKEYVYIPYPSKSQILDKFEAEVEFFWDIDTDCEAFDQFSEEDIELLKNNSISNIIAIYESIAKIRIVHEREKVFLKETPPYCIITTQAELDEIPNDYDGGIVVLGNYKEPVIIRNKYKKAVQVLFSLVELRNDAFVKASCDAEVRAYDNSCVEAYDRATIKAYDNAKIYKEESSMVTVELFDNATMEELKNK